MFLYTTVNAMRTLWCVLSCPMYLGLYVIAFSTQHHFSKHDTNLLFILGRPILLKQLLLHRLIDSLAFIFLSHIPSALFFLVISFLHTLLYRFCSVMLYFHPSLIGGLFLIYNYSLDILLYVLIVANWNFKMLL